MTSRDEEELSSRVIDQIVTQGWGRPRKGHLISSESQIYYDLSIYGDDFYELVRWMHEDFGVQTMSGFERYAPLESPFHQLRAVGRKLLGLARPQFGSLSVIDVANIITKGKWP